MKLEKHIAVIALTMGVCCSLNAAITFDFQFDDNPFGVGLQTPLVGTGSFTFATDPGDGTFAFSSLGTYTMAFSFVDGDTYSGADIQSDLSLVLVVLSGSGSQRRLQFSDTGGGGGGPFFGSLDLVNPGGNGLSFEPSYFGGGLNFYGEFGGGFFIGHYLALESVPEPTTIISGLSALGFVLVSSLRRFSRSSPAIIEN